MARTGSRRVYLDWNATAPLRPEARAAMLEAMDAVGNPSSVHAEGRVARGIVERARAQVAGLVGCEPDEVVFTSGATEAASIADTDHVTVGSGLEHDCVYKTLIEPWAERGVPEIAVTSDGLFDLDDFNRKVDSNFGTHEPVFSVALLAAQNETGVLQDITGARDIILRRTPAGSVPPSLLCDAVQCVGRVEFDFYRIGADFALVSGHKIGAAKGVGALLTRDGEAGENYRRWGPKGSQERGRRSGTENVIGIAGFGAAAEAARRDLADGLWDDVFRLRQILEEGIERAAPDVTFFGRGAPRLPNTSCFAVPGWKGETQVMALDLAGFAVSAGSACSSGKVAESRVLRAMGADAETARSAIRVSLGPTTTEGEVLAFVEAWKALYAKRARRAALAG